jgi:hypothetical protein
MVKMRSDGRPVDNETWCMPLTIMTRVVVLNLREWQRLVPTSRHCLVRKGEPMIRRTGQATSVEVPIMPRIFCTAGVGRPQVRG